MAGNRSVHYGGGCRALALYNAKASCTPHRRKPTVGNAHVRVHFLADFKRLVGIIRVVHILFLGTTTANFKPLLKKEVSMNIREPLSTEGSAFQELVESRDADGLRQLVDKHPDVIWGSVLQGLSAIDRVWVNKVVAKPRETDDYT